MKKTATRIFFDCAADLGVLQKYYNRVTDQNRQYYNGITAFEAAETFRGAICPRGNTAERAAEYQQTPYRAMQRKDEGQATETGKRSEGLKSACMAFDLSAKTFFNGQLPAKNHHRAK